MGMLAFLISISVGEAVKMLNETCLEPYISPVVKAFLMGLNTNLYQTGRSHNFLGGDISVSFAMVVVPDEYDYAEYKVLKWNSSEMDFTDTVIIKWTTASGPIKHDTSLGNMYLPPMLPRGFNVGITPLVLAQLNIGLLKGIEVGCRYFPVFKLLGEKFRYWGTGVKIDFKKLGVQKEFPIPISCFIFYQSIRWGDFVKVDAFSLDLIFCKRIFTLTPFISPGIGFARAMFSYGFSYYDPLTGEKKEESIKLTFGYFEPKLTAGIRVRVPIFPFVGLTFVVNTIFTKFPSFSIGVGITAR